LILNGQSDNKEPVTLRMCAVYKCEVELASQGIRTNNGFIIFLTRQRPCFG